MLGDNMLTAKLNNQLIDLTGLSRNEIIQKHQNHLPYICPHCEGDMILKYGMKKRAHFAHKVPCEYQCSESESEEHRISKFLLASYLELQGATSIRIEKRFQDILRIADLYFEWNHQAYVIEIQKSAISQSLFESRVQDYRSKGIEVLWVFIGDLKEKPQTYLINKVMALNKHHPLIHLNIMTEEVTLFNQIIWLNPKEVKAQANRVYLKNLQMTDLLNDQEACEGVNLTQWLAIKKEFRCIKWQQYIKSERELVRLCYGHRLTLSLMPSEVGWPIANHQGFTKPLFIWQAYVLIGFIMSKEIGSFFNLTDLVNRLKGHYHLKIDQYAIKALKAYLLILARLQIISNHKGYYEVLKYPRVYHQLGEVLEEDRKVGNLLKQKN